MHAQPSNPLHQPETEFQGEVLNYSGPALDPDDPNLEHRVRKGRPTDSQTRPKTGEKNKRPKE